MVTAPEWTIQRGFPEALRSRAAELYFEAFSGKLGGLLGPRNRAIAFFSRIFDPEFVLCAVTADRRSLLGIAGFKTAEGSLTGGGLGDLASIYGWFGTLWRAPLLALLERDTVDDQLLMDGIAVTKEARGLGIGTALLEAIAEEAQKRDVRAVRLDVVDSNPRAMALYERFGFQAKSTEKTGPFRLIFGFSSSTRMELEVATRQPRVS